MTRTPRLSPAERDARNLLENEGYRVMPMRSCFVSRYKPVNLMARRGPDVLVYLKLSQIARLPDCHEIREEIFSEDAWCLRTFFPLDPGAIKLRKEIWVPSPSGGFSCFEILPDRIREVAGRVPAMKDGKKRPKKRNR